MLGAIVLVKFLTQHLDPVKYGELTLGLTIGGLVNQIITGGVSASIVRFFSIAFEKQDINNYFRGSVCLMRRALITIIATSGILIFFLFCVGRSEWIPLVIAILILSIFNGLLSTLSGLQNAARQRRIVSFHSCIDAWLKILFAGAMIASFGNNGASVVIGYILSALIVSGSQLLFNLRLLKIIYKTKVDISMPTNDWFRDMQKFSLPISSWGIFTWMQQSSDRWALQIFSSTDDVGIYSVLFQLGYVPISLAAGLVMNLVAPILYQRVGNATDHSRVQNVYDVTNKLAILVILLTSICAAVVSIFHEYLFNVLTNEEYHVYSSLAPMLVLASGFQACHHVFGMRISAMLEVRRIVIPQILSAVFFVGLNFLGAYFWGFKGVVYGFTVSSFFYFAWMFVLSEVIIIKHRNSCDTFGEQL